MISLLLNPLVHSHRHTLLDLPVVSDMAHSSLIPLHWLLGHHSLGFLSYWPLLLRVLCCFRFICPSLDAGVTQELDLAPIFFSVCPYSFGNRILSQGFKYHLYNGNSKFMSPDQTSLSSRLVYLLPSLHLTYCQLTKPII